MPVKVLLIDDSDIFRKAANRFLSGHSEIHLVGETDNLPDGVKLCEELKPQVVVLDLRLATGWKSEPFDVECIRNAASLIAVSAAAHDEDSTGLAEQIGAVEMLDKMELVEKLVPAILRAAKQSQSAHSD